MDDSSSKVMYDYYQQEYQALRSEKLQRYEYASKLNERLISSTIAIWTVTFAIYAVFNGNINSDQLTKPVSESFMISLQCLQIILLVLPSYISTFVFKASQNNSIRIHLISDYLRNQVHNISQSSQIKTWENMKNQKNKEMFYFYDFDWIDSKDYNDIKNEKTGELLGIHRGISWISMLFACGLFCGIADSCLPYLFNPDIDISKITNWIWLYTLIPFVVVGVLQICLLKSDERFRSTLCVFKWCLCFCTMIFFVSVGCYHIQNYQKYLVQGISRMTIILYVFSYVVIITSLLCIPCYGLRQSFTKKIIDDNEILVTKYWENAFWD